MDASDYDAFWLWAGVEPQPELDRAQTIYLMAGEIRARNPGKIEILRPVPQVEHADLWLVLRVETLDWPEEHYRTLLEIAKRWDDAGNRLAGIQIDFDANTRHLDRYAEFLRDLRRRLPEQYRLGITGLMDWSANGDPTHLAALADVVDEAVFQLYQDRDTIEGYQQWLGRLDDLPMPFRIGLVQGGQWQEPGGLADNRNFKGYVVFLLNQ